METTTKLDEVKKRPHTFIWGRVVKIHEISRYTILEYEERVLNGKESTGRVLFHPYVNDEDLHTSCTSLESAIVHAIAIAVLGPYRGTWMAMAACKLLGLNEV